MGLARRYAEMAAGAKVQDGVLGFPFDIAADATVRDDEDAVGELEVERPIERPGVCYAQIMRVGR